MPADQAKLFVLPCLSVVLVLAEQSKDSSIF